MEAFESFVALTMEAEGLVVYEAVKFRVKVVVPSREGFQTHGFEVDLVGANSRKLVLASVKSFLGSRGVASEHVAGTSTNQTANRRYAMFNNAAAREGVVDGACKLYGYTPKQLELRLYAGKFADKQGQHRKRIADFLSGLDIGGGKVRVFGLDDVVPQAIELAGSTQYRDNAALVATKVLDAAGRLVR